MGRYLGPKERIERRLGERLGLKGERSDTPKHALVRRPYPPGQHGPNYRPGRPSEYSNQLKSKQKIRNTYRMMEKQFKTSVKKALTSDGSPYDAIVKALELRLDNAVFRSGYTQTRDQARQIVNHGHMTVNGKKVGIPSAKVGVGDVIGIREVSKTRPFFSTIMPQWFLNHEAPEWLGVDKEKGTSTVKAIPTPEDSGLQTTDIQAIIEFYSR
jgi:small subunit ribosomal protein S4